MSLKAHTDCNSPSHWSNGTFYIFNSWENPWRTSGPDLFHLGPSSPVKIDSVISGGRWLESTWLDSDGTLYGWYHQEPDDICHPGKLAKRYPTVARVGAMVSPDNGANWHDLGIILEGPPALVNCDTRDSYYAGGEGDFAVLPDRERKFFYFFLTTFYHGDISQQGIAVARMPFEDRKLPVNRVKKWRDAAWDEDGMWGRVTPVIPVTTDWHDANAHNFWGPSPHWNSYLNQYVMMLNRVRDGKWAAEGIYITFNPDISNPHGWSTPMKVLDREEIIRADPNKIDSGWYVTLVGTGKGETDKEIGRTARLFVTGSSRWEITFHRPGELQK